MNFALSGRLLAAAFVVMGIGLSVGCSASTSDDSGTTDQEITRGARTCAHDSDCNHGVEGLGIICVVSGKYAGSCGDGCHVDDDCPGGGSCDKSTAHWACDDPLPKIGTACKDDAFCSGVSTEGYDDPGTIESAPPTTDPDGTANEDDSETHEPSGRVCSTRSHTCIIGCHTDDDCPGSTVCDQSGTNPVCKPITPGSGPGGGGSGSGSTGGSTGSGGGGSGGSSTADPPADGEPTAEGCPAVRYPSGVTLVTKSDAAMTAKYKALNATSCALPKCFLDLSDLRSPDGTTFDVNVNLSESFTLNEFVHTEVEGGFSNLVLVDPAFVARLEETRKLAGGAIAVNSGFRSPDHQRATCKSLCGCTQCVSNGHGGNRCGSGGGKVTCAANSRHMWGSAADLSLSFSKAARNAGIPFVFDEFGGTGAHLHVDMKACQ